MRLIKNFNTLLAGCTLTLLAATATAAPFDVAGPAVDDIDPPSATPRVVDFDVTDTGEIANLQVEILVGQNPDGSTTYWDNVFFQLSHNGVDVLLMHLDTDDAGPDSQLAALFADGGADLASSLVIDGVTVGTFAPASPLSAFNGLPLEGTWTLTMWDDNEPNDGTDLLAIELSGETVDAVAPPPTPAPAQPVPALPMAWLLLLVSTVVAAGASTLHRRKKR